MQDEVAAPDRKRSPGLAHEIVAGLTQRIRLGQIAPGATMPSESTLVREHGVSRTVVREAISQLQASGLVETRHGIGTFVLALIIDALANFSQLDRGKVIIDHVEEHTVGLVQDAGYWAGMTLYPESKCTPNRAIDMLETYDSSRLWLNSACDWGVSDPLAVVKCAFEMKRRKHTPEQVEEILFENPKRFLSQSKNFRI